MQPRRFWFQIFLLPLVSAADTIDQLDFDDFGDFREVISFFEGVQPVSYNIDLRLPIEIDAAKRNRTTGRYSTKGNVSLTFRWISNNDIFQVQRLLALHSKSIKIEKTSIRLWQLRHSPEIGQVNLPIEKVIVNDGEELITFRLSVENRLQMKHLYRLEIGEFSGRVEEDGSKNAIFLTSPGLATQFQLNDARRAFPCVDMPGKKAVFTFTIRHPSTYIALSNTDMDVGAMEPADADGWAKTTFRTTPIMSTYVVAFALIPKTFVEKASLTTEATDGLRLSIFYNPDRLTNPRQPTALLKYASQAYENLRRTFSPRLPLAKLDVCVVKGLSILGMENWGMVNLKEEFVVKENEVEQFGLLAHEFVHQWIGNLATTADWRHLCVQEGLTEHYARRTLADFYGGPQSSQYQRYIFIRYLPAVQNETNNIGLKPIRQNFQGFDEAVAYCFGRVPFIWTMIERIVGGRRAFDLLINRFLTDFSFKNFVLDDLTSYLNQSGPILQYYVDHGGYPSLFVRRLNESVYRLRQRQIVPLSNVGIGGEASFEVPSTKDLWPIPLSTTNGQRLMSSTEYDLAQELMPLDDRRVPLLNPDFAYFYRVNYEANTWATIAEALLTSPKSYSEMARAQFLNDYCFFRGLNLIRFDNDDNETLLKALTKQFLNVQSQLELSTNIYVRFYTKGC